MATPVLIVGATGAQGGAVIRALRRDASFESLEVYGLTRNPASPAAKKLESEGIKTVKGDLGNTEDLTRILKRFKRAFLVTDNTQGVAKEQTTGLNFVKAAKAANLSHVVFTSVDGAERNSGVPHFDSKFEIENALKATGIDWTILRPVAFMDNYPMEPGFAQSMALGVFQTALKKGTSLQLISVKDIGYFGAQALLHPEQYAGQAIGLAGDSLTIEQTAEAISKIQSRPAKISWVPGFMLSVIPRDMRLMFKFFRERGYTVDIPALRERYPELSTFDDFVSSKKTTK